MQFAYEDVRIAPHSELTRVLIAIPLEDELAIDDCDEAVEHGEAMHNTTRESCSPNRGVDNINGNAIEAASGSHVSTALLWNTQSPALSTM